MYEPATANNDAEDALLRPLVLEIESVRPLDWSEQRRDQRTTGLARS
jgi:hypothetical protein